MILFPTLNVSLFEAIHGLAGHSTLLDYTAIFFAEYVQYVIAAGLGILLLWGTSHLESRVMVITAAIAAVFSRFAVKSLVLIFIAEPRPFVYLHFVPLVAASAGEELQSFPSGHALFFFALAMTLYLFNKKIGVLALAAAILMGLARIYTGVHWPLDIVAGALLGMGVGYFMHAFYIRNSVRLQEWIVRLKLS